MEARISPLRLDRYFLKELHYELNAGFDRDMQSADEDTLPSVTVGVTSAEQDPDNRLKWRFELKLELAEDPEGNFPYKIGATMVGYFTVSEDYAAERADEMARANGPALLYSGARELVRSVTGRGPYPPLLLPSITFVQSKVEEAKPVQQELPTAKKVPLLQSGKGIAKKAENEPARENISEQESE